MYVRIVGAPSPTTLERLVNNSLLGVSEDAIIAQHFAVANEGGSNVRYVLAIMIGGNDPQDTGPQAAIGENNYEYKER